MSVKNLNVKPNAFKGEWIASRIDEKCIQFMEDFGYHLCAKKKPDDRYPGRDAVTTSQLRTIFGEVKRIEVKLGKENVAQDILMLRPKIAYNAARVISQNRYSRINDLKEVLEAAHSNINTGDLESFKRFSRFLEGIIAYHKVYGGN